MISRDSIRRVIAKYNRQAITVGILGSHSVLDVCTGAKAEGLRTLVVCAKGREATYAKYFRRRKRFDMECGIIDDIVILERFSDILDKKTQKILTDSNTIFVPHRSFTVYVPYTGIESEYKVPIFGNRKLLRAEERDAENNQYFLLEKAGIRTPKRFKSYEDIDTLSIVKVPENIRKYERAFFFASSPKDYEKTAEKLLHANTISKNALDSAVIEEFALGAQVNFNYFYSPLLEELELLGTDTRRQTNLDGLLRLPSPQQLEVLKYSKVKNIEVGHIAVTVRESLLEQAFEIGERFVKATKEVYPPGVIGPFALQGAVLPGPPHEEIVVFDVSLRVPGSPGTKFTGYTDALWGSAMSTGHRIALEIKQAVKRDRIIDIVT